MDELSGVTAEASPTSRKTLGKRTSRSVTTGMSLAYQSAVVSERNVIKPTEYHRAAEGASFDQQPRQPALAFHLSKWIGACTLKRISERTDLW